MLDYKPTEEELWDAIQMQNWEKVKMFNQKDI